MDNSNADNIFVDKFQRKKATAVFTTDSQVRINQSWELTTAMPFRKRARTNRNILPILIVMAVKRSCPIFSFNLLILSSTRYIAQESEPIRIKITPSASNFSSWL